MSELNRAPAARRDRRSWAHLLVLRDFSFFILVTFLVNPIIRAFDKTMVTLLYCVWKVTKIR